MSGWALVAAGAGMVALGWALRGPSRRRGGGVHVVDPYPLPDGYTPPSASLDPPREAP